MYAESLGAFQIVAEKSVLPTPSAVENADGGPFVIVATI